MALAIPPHFGPELWVYLLSLSQCGRGALTLLWCSPKHIFMLRTLSSVDCVVWSWANNTGWVFLKVLSVSGWFDSDCSTWNAQVASERRGVWIQPPVFEPYSLFCSPALAQVTALRETVTPATAVKSPPPLLPPWSLSLSYRKKIISPDLWRSQECPALLKIRQGPALLCWVQSLFLL